MFRISCSLDACLRHGYIDIVKCTLCKMCLVVGTKNVAFCFHVKVKKKKKKKQR